MAETTTGATVVNYEVKSEGQGYRIYKDGKKQDYSLSGSKTIISVLSIAIQRESPDGGTISVLGHHFADYVKVPGCPTGHANIRDDFMGGSNCADCRAHW